MVIQWKSNTTAYAPPWELFGSRGVTSEVLNGKRVISKTHARALPTSSMYLPICSLARNRLPAAARVNCVHPTATADRGMDE